MKNGYIYSRDGFGLVECRVDDARARRQGESPLVLMGLACAALCLAASGLRALFVR